MKEYLGWLSVTKETQGLERKCAARDFVSVQGFGIYSTQKRSYKIFFWVETEVSGIP